MRTQGPGLAAAWGGLVVASLLAVMVARAQEAGITAPIGSADEQVRRTNARRHRASAAYLELKGNKEEAMKEFEASLNFLDDPAIRKKVAELKEELAMAGAPAPLGSTNASPPAAAGTPPAAVATNAPAGAIAPPGIASESPASAATNASPVSVP